MMAEFNKTLEDYLSSVYVISHSYSTVATYRLSVTNKKHTGFKDFLQQQYNIDELQLVEKINKQELDIYKILKEFVIFLDKSNYSPKSIHSRLAAVKGFIRHLGIKVYVEDFKQSVRLPKVMRHREEPLTKDIILRILHNLPAKLQTIVLVLTASGMRIGELVQLKISDIDFTSNPTTIRIRAETTKTRQERETFLTGEATTSLKDYLKRFHDWQEGKNNVHLTNTMIFGRTSLIRSQKIKQSKRPQHLNASTALMQSLIYYLNKVPGLDNTNQNGRKIIHFHAFRKFFRTTVGNACGRDFAEALIGHGFYMDTYYQLSEDKKQELYLKAEPNLIISDYKIVESNMKSLTENYQKLEKRFDGLMQYLEIHGISVPEAVIRKS